MFKKWLPLFLLACVLSGWSLFAADGEIGKVVEFSGEVLIDAFGKGSFIQVVRDELLYEESILKTGLNGTVVIRLKEFQFEIPSGSIVNVSEFPGYEFEKNNFIWFQSILDLLKDVIKSPANYNEKTALGGRAGKTESEDMEWMSDEEIDKSNFFLAQKNIQTAQYSNALKYLFQIEDTQSIFFLPGAINFWKGFCYFQKGNFSDAEKYLNTASLQFIYINFVNSDFPYQNTVLFQLGVANYFLEQEAKAIEYFEALFEIGPIDKYKPYVYIFMIDSLAKAGDLNKAEIYLTEARKLYKGTSLEKEFLNIPEKSSIY